MRPSEIHKCLLEAAPRVLDMQLKEMVEDGLIAKTIYPELPPRSEHRITDLGKSLLPIIDTMMKWGEEHYEIFEKSMAPKADYPTNPQDRASCESSKLSVLRISKGECPVSGADAPHPLDKAPNLCRTQKPQSIQNHLTLHYI